MFRPLSLAFAAIGLASLPALAQDDGEDVPEAAWENRFMGSYAEDGACSDADRVWQLTDSSVQAGGVICNTLGKMTWEDGFLVVPMSDCQGGGAAVEDRVRALRRDDATGALNVLGGEGMTTLQSCPEAP